MPVPDSPATIDPSSVVRTRLPNGLTVLIRRDKSAPVVAIVTFVSAGYFDETDDIVGIAHVLEHMHDVGVGSPDAMPTWNGSSAKRGCQRTRQPLGTVAQSAALRARSIRKSRRSMRGNITPALQVGLGGGTRIGFALRTSPPRWR